VRVVLIATIAPAVESLYGALRAFGHEPVALLTTREHVDRYGAQLETLLRDAPAELDVVIPSRRERIAPLLGAFEPDVAFCAGFPWKIPAEAVAVPRHGIVNGHPSLLPKYRGPSPVASAIRAGETEVGFTFHYMDAELDTGNVLGQVALPLGDARTWDELTPKLVEAVGGLFPAVLAKVEAGDPGDPQPEGEGGYESFFEPEYVRIDWSRTADEIERQVRAWRFHAQTEGEHGALAELDGETVRVLQVSREPAGGRAMECGDGTLWIVETEPA
jgi:methionyl-tRNA formyltransferase